MNDRHVRPNHDDHHDFRAAMKAYQVLLWYIAFIVTVGLMVLLFTH